MCFNDSIMKARKTMKNQQLIQEVIAQISQRFAPKIPDIKKVMCAAATRELSYAYLLHYTRPSTIFLRRNTLSV